MIEEAIRGTGTSGKPARSALSRSVTMPVADTELDQITKTDKRDAPAKNGHIADMRIPLVARSWYIDRTKPTKPALAAPYCGPPTMPV
jgi:hypothetical protein